MQSSRAVTKYLERYAEPGIDVLIAQLFAPAKHKHDYQHCLCIPVFDEGEQFLQRLQVLAAAQARSLFIVVLNQPDTLAVASAANRQLANTLAAQFKLLARAYYAQLYAVGIDSALILVDRYTAGRQIAASQGVGRARKIAGDIALRLISERKVQQPYIYCSDADASFPANYFTAPQENAGHKATPIAAWLYPFKHIDTQPIPGQALQDSASIYRATRLYEQRIKAYVDGLAYAGSAYAYHTLGSTLCIAAEHYAMVRGFPCRSAGEDFYILNKLRKTGTVITLAQPVICLDARSSTRTPFGTGSAAQKLAANTEPEPKIFYHPALFLYLRILLQWFVELGECSTQRKPQPWPETLNRYIDSQCKGSDGAIECPATSLPPGNHSEIMLGALNAIDFDAGLQHCARQAGDAEEFAKHLFCWFDAFKTLKFLHQMRASTPPLGNLGQSAMEREWSHITGLPGDASRLATTA